jgi:hypothetical protein
VLREQHHRRADEFGDGLGARTAEQGGESGDLDIVELVQFAVLARDLRGDEPADHVVLRVLPALLHQRVVVDGGVDIGLHAGFGIPDLPGFAGQTCVDPVPHLLAVLVFDTGHSGDHLDRERRGEVLDDVELVAGDPAQEAVDLFDDGVLLGLYRARCERLVEQTAHVPVIRWIHEDDGFLRRFVALHHRQVASAGGRERLVVLESRGHVRVPGEGVEVLVGAVVQRRFVAHPPVDLERIGEVLLGERIENEFGRRHSGSSFGVELPPQALRKAAKL